MSKNTKNNKVMKSATLEASHPVLVTFKAASVSYGSAVTKYCDAITSAVSALRAEGFPDDSIRGALREAVSDIGCCRIYLNRILVTKTENGGCGMAVERVRAKTDKAKKEAAPAVKPRASTSSPVKISDPVSLFAALAVDHAPLAIASIAEKLYNLATEAALKGICAPKK